MSTSEIMIIINSCLTGIITLLLSVSGFLIKDLHAQFRELVTRTNTLYAELTRVSVTNQLVQENHKKEIERISVRLDSLSA